jgi:beta-glucuronidase
VHLDGLRRRGTNRLVVRVNSIRNETDLPPRRLNDGVPSGGWWNYGGLLREVYLQRIDTVELETTRILPRLGCRNCEADVRMESRVRNRSSSRRRVTLTGRFGGRRIRLGAATLAPGRAKTLRGSLRIADPRLWEPERPYLDPASVEARVGGRRVARWSVHSGVRSIKVSGGRLYLNGRPANVRGVGMHEDDPTLGMAVDNAWREWFVSEAQALGATMLRTRMSRRPIWLMLRSTGTISPSGIDTAMPRFTSP